MSVPPGKANVAPYLVGDIPHYGFALCWEWGGGSVRGVRVSFTHILLQQTLPCASGKFPKGDFS